MKYKRIFLIVLDSVGIGKAKDANKFGDEGADTIGHICENMDKIHLPVLEKLGLGNLGNFKGIASTSSPLAYTSRVEEVSNGKDTMTGHWEMMGLKTEKPFITFTDTGFPDEFIKEFEKRTGRKCVGNKAASGTAILDELGEYQIATGDWIVYTSADSVFQVAANEEIIPLEELYNACKIARELAMDDRWKVGRIIARPYIGSKKGAFKRTSNRRDLALAPFGKTVLDSLKEHQYDVIGIGKIPDIFVDQGITENIHTVSNHDGMIKTMEQCQRNDLEGLVFTNLVDFDAVYGHRRNVIGYGHALEEFDTQLKDMLEMLKDDDLLMITADHGNDPTWKGTDHTRENVPLIIYNRHFKEPKYLGIRESYAIMGATIADNFNVENPGIGTSILKELK